MHERPIVEPQHQVPERGLRIVWLVLVGVIVLCLVYMLFMGQIGPYYWQRHFGDQVPRTRWMLGLSPGSLLAGQMSQVTLGALPWILWAVRISAGGRAGRGRRLQQGVVTWLLLTDAFLVYLMQRLYDALWAGYDRNLERVTEQGVEHLAHTVSLPYRVLALPFIRMFGQGAPDLYLFLYVAAWGLAMTVALWLLGWSTKALSRRNSLPVELGAEADRDTLP